MKALLILLAASFVFSPRASAQVPPEGEIEKKEAPGGMMRVKSQELEQMIERALERVMRRLRDEELAQKQELETAVQRSMPDVVKAWVEELKARRNSQLNGFLPEDINPLFEQPWLKRKFTLSGFEHPEPQVDVIETQSLSAPYRTIVRAQEILRVEMEHFEKERDPVNLERYHYTVTLPLEAVFGYQGNRWVLERVEAKDMKLRPGW